MLQYVIITFQLCIYNRIIRLIKHLLINRFFFLFVVDKLCIMSEANLSCMLYGKGDLRLENWPTEQPQQGHVVVAIQQAGICGTDVHTLKDGKLGYMDIQAPRRLGHEAAGVVTDVGPGVSGFKAGDRVVLNPVVHCRKCDNCQGGMINLCPNMQSWIAAPRQIGFFARTVVHPADWCYKLPDNLSFEEGAMVEPLAVAVRACKRADLTLGHNVLVCGAGPIGLMCVLAARAMGAGKVCVTNTSEHRLAVAAQLGADHCIMVKEKSPEVVAQEVKDFLGGPGVHITMDTSSAQDAMDTATLATRPGGSIVLTGCATMRTSIDAFTVTVCELTILGSMCYDITSFPVAIEMMASGRVDVKPLVSHRFPLSAAVEAFETAASKRGSDGAVKVMISFVE